MISTYFREFGSSLKRLCKCVLGKFNVIFFFFNFQLEMIENCTFYQHMVAISKNLPQNPIFEIKIILHKLFFWIEIIENDPL